MDEELRALLGRVRQASTSTELRDALSSIRVSTDASVAAAVADTAAGLLASFPSEIIEFLAATILPNCACDSTAVKQCVSGARNAFTRLTDTALSTPIAAPDALAATLANIVSVMGFLRTVVKHADSSIGTSATLQALAQLSTITDMSLEAAIGSLKFTKSFSKFASDNSVISRTGHQVNEILKMTVDVIKCVLEMLVRLEVGTVFDCDTIAAVRHAITLLVRLAEAEETSGSSLVNLVWKHIVKFIGQLVSADPSGEHGLADACQLGAVLAVGTDRLTSAFETCLAACDRAASAAPEDKTAFKACRFLSFFLTKVSHLVSVCPAADAAVQTAGEATQHLLPLFLRIYEWKAQGDVSQGARNDAFQYLPSAAARLCAHAPIFLHLIRTSPPTTARLLFLIDLAQSSTKIPLFSDPGVSIASSTLPPSLALFDALFDVLHNTAPTRASRAADVPVLVDSPLLFDELEHALCVLALSIPAHLFAHVERRLFAQLLSNGHVHAQLIALEALSLLSRQSSDLAQAHAEHAVRLLLAMGYDHVAHDKLLVATLLSRLLRSLDDSTQASFALKHSGARRLAAWTHVRLVSLSPAFARSFIPAVVALSYKMANQWRVLSATGSFDDTQTKTLRTISATLTCLVRVYQVDNLVTDNVSDDVHAHLTQWVCDLVVRGVAMLARPSASSSSKAALVDALIVSVDLVATPTMVCRLSGDDTASILAALADVSVRDSTFAPLWISTARFLGQCGRASVSPRTAEQRAVGAWKALFARLVGDDVSWLVRDAGFSSLFTFMKHTVYTDLPPALISEANRPVFVAYVQNEPYDPTGGALAPLVDSPEHRAERARVWNTTVACQPSLKRPNSSVTPDDGGVSRDEKRTRLSTTTSNTTATSAATAPSVSLVAAVRNSIVTLQQHQNQSVDPEARLALQQMMSVIQSLLT